MTEQQFKQTSDQELVKLTLQDKSFYVFLVERYEEKLRWYVRRTVGVTVEEAEDIVQEVFIKTYLNLNDFDPQLKFSSWIYRIAHNEAINYVRYRKRRPLTVELDQADNDWLLLRDDLDIVQSADQALLVEPLRQALEQLEDKYRQVLILRYWEDKDYQEISDILHLPLGSVATLLNRGKKQLKQILQDNNFGQTYV